jgi:hypothetical protein
MAAAVSLGGLGEEVQAGALRRDGAGRAGARRGDAADERAGLL